MKRTSIRLPEELARWLRDTAQALGRSINAFVCDHLRAAKDERNNKLYMKFAGRLKGLPRDLSMRKGFGPR